MQILSAAQIRAWDDYTIIHEPIASIDLMERAANACCEWIIQQGFEERSFYIFCAKGNNGGDGLAIARILLEKGYRVFVHILEFGHKGTDDFQTNLARLHDITKNIFYIQQEDQFPILSPQEIIIDALFGSGLNRPLDTHAGQLVNWINNTVNTVISIDIPSGLFTDQSSKKNIAVKATHTLSFQCYKPAFLVAENDEYIGMLHVLDIGLHPDYIKTIQASFEFADMELMKSIYRPRNRFSHKGNFGHALLVGGSYGKMGAVVLAAKACVRTGSGLLSCYIPASGYEILQSTVPEAMVIADSSEKNILHTLPDPSIYKAMGIGPGLSTQAETSSVLEKILKAFKKAVVLDADALNILSLHAHLFKLIPHYSILTPHQKEFDRVFGQHGNEFDRIQTARKVSKEKQVIIVLKGHYTFIAMPGGKGYFNTSGNAGMAKGGSGDALTGILTSLLAQGYLPGEAALLGVFLHGLAGDLALKEQSMESLLPSDLIESIGDVFKLLQS